MDAANDDQSAILFSKGDLVWYDQGDYPVPAEVLEVDGVGGSAKIRSVVFGEETIVVATFTQLQRRLPPDQNLNSADDLVQVNDISEGTLLWALRNRFEQGKIYTYIGRILLAFNPKSGSALDAYYGPEIVQRYCNRVLGSLPPHVFAIAEAAYANMRFSGREQVLLASGESGSGKSETCKHLIKYLTMAAPCLRGRLEPGRKNVTVEQILAAAPILESFGHAATSANENSTRCAFTTELVFRQGTLCGAEYLEYVLEKNRIVSHPVGERNFHVFYELLAGLKAELKDKFGLSNAEKYFYLNQGKNIELRSRSDKENFRTLQSAFDILGFGGDQKHSIFRILAAVLHIGNVYYNRQQTPQHQEAVSIGNEAELQWISYLLQLDPDVLKAFLTTKTSEVRDERVVTPLNIDKALDIRDAIAKALYTQLFSWLFNRINQSVRKNGKEGSIVLMDAFGFESLKTNSFEQLCVNYANERIHAYFVDSIFRKEQDEYNNEKIVWREKIGLQLNNQPVLDLLARRPSGIFHVLDDECSFPKGTDESFLQKCHYSHVDSPLYGKPRMHNPEFCIRHYAGPVWYDASGFLEKNRDVLRANVVGILIDSHNSMISQMFKNWKNIQESVPKPKLPSAMATFANGLNLLMKKIVKGDAHFIRCINPSTDKVAGKFDMAVVLRQLRHLGISETVRIRKLGYPIRFRFSSFVSRYNCLVPRDSMKNMSEREACSAVLSTIVPQLTHMCQIGNSKVFLKELVYDTMEMARQRRLYAAAVLIQKNARVFVLRKKYVRMKLAAIRIQAAVRGWIARNQSRRMKLVVLRDAEQQAKRSRQLQMYERMRQEAAALEEPSEDKRHRNFAVTGVHHLDLPVELGSLLDSMPEWDRRNRQERIIRTAASDLAMLPCQDGRYTLPPDLQNYPFAKFAQANFKAHVWQMRREPVATPFLPKENDTDFDDSLTIFKMILRYMNDVTLTFTQETMLANFIVQKGLSKPSLRDEIYAQLVNQTHENPNPANRERGWWLIGLCASAFPPSPTIYKYILSYIVNSDCNGYKTFLEKRLSQCAHNEWSLTRRYPPCLIEHKATQDRGKMALTATLADGNVKKCQVEPWTTAGELAQLVLREQGLDETRGWTVSFSSPEVDIRLNAADYVLDVISYFELPNTFPAAKSEFVVAPKPPSSRNAASNGTSAPEDRRPVQEPSRPSAMTASSLNKRYTVHNQQHHQTDVNAERSKPTGQPISKNYGNRHIPADSSVSSSPVSDPTQEMAPVTNMAKDTAHKAPPNSLPLDSKQAQHGGAVRHQQMHGRANADQLDRSTLKTYAEQRNATNNMSAGFHMQPKREQRPVDVEQLENVRSAPQRALLHMDEGRFMVAGSTKSVDMRREIPEVVLPPSYSTKTSTVTDMTSIHPDEMGFVRGGLPRSRVAPSEYSARSMASHVRNVAIPSKNSDVEKFLDDLFEPVLHDSTTDDIYDLRSIAASIKGGGDNSTLTRNVPNRSGMMNPQTPAMMLTTAQMMPTLMSHVNQPVIMMLPMDSMRMFNMAAPGNNSDGNYGTGNSEWPIVQSPNSTIDPRRNSSSNLMDTNTMKSNSSGHHYQNRAHMMNNNVHQQYQYQYQHHQQPPIHYQQQLQLSPVPSATAALYAPAMLSPTPSTITAITAPTVPVMPLQVSTIVPMVTALASPVLAVQQQHLSPVGYNQMTSQRQNSMLSPTAVPPEPSYPAPSTLQPDPPAVVHIPSDRPHPMARHQQVPMSLRSQTRDGRSGQMEDFQYRGQMIYHPHQAYSGETPIDRYSAQQAMQGNYRLNRDYSAGALTMTSSVTGVDEYEECEDDTTSGTYSATASSLSYGINQHGHRGRRIFNRSGPPTTITEENSEASESFDRQGNGFLVGRMKPTSNNARYIGSVQMGGQPSGKSQIRDQPGHTIRDITKSARDGSMSPSSVQPTSIPSAVLPNASGSHRNDTAPSHPTAIYSPHFVPSPPAQPMLDPHSDIRRNQEAALEKMKQNLKHLPAPVEDMRMSKHQSDIHHQAMDQDYYTQEKSMYRSPMAYNTGSHERGKAGQPDEDDQLAQQREDRKRDAAMKAQQKQLQQQHHQAYLAAEREWRAQLNKSGREEEDEDAVEEQNAGQSLHQHGDQYDRYGFSKTGYAHSIGATMEKEDGKGKREEEERDRFGDWVQEHANIPAYKDDRQMYRNDGYDEECNAEAHRDMQSPVSDSVVWHLANGDGSKGLEGLREMTRDPRRKGPLFTYEDVPWTLHVQKELFYPNESLMAQEKLDMVFYQIVRDVCEWNPFRIRRHEKDQMLATFRYYDIDTQTMKSPKLTASVKRNVVDTARTWPLYFCRFYPIVEDRRSEYVAQWLAISETGVRLVLRSYANAEEPLKISEHFEFEDIDRVEVLEQGVLAITTFNKRQVRLYTDRAESIKALVDEYLYGPNQGKQYVRASADYITKEPNLLSFHKGDIIQLVSNMQENYMGTGWLYGKLNNRYGNFPSNYVESLSADIQQPDQFGGGLEDGMGPVGYGIDQPMDPMMNGSTMHRPGKGKMTMMEFAMMHFRHAPSGGKTDDGEVKAPRKSKKEWTWKEFADMVKFSKSPIQSSLLKLDKSELNKLSVECFINIMTYMGDYPMKKDATFVDCVYKLLMACHHHPPMRDEMYCQIIKQTTNNKSSKPDSAILGWRLFSILTAYFDCSNVLQSYLMKYLSEAASDVRRAYHGTAAICLLNMKQTFKYGGRKYLLSAKEIESITNGKNLKRQVYHLPGGTKKVVNTKSITVVEEVIQELCQELNIRSPLEQQEFCLCYVVESENAMKLMANDEYILDVTTELEFKRKDYFLLLKRTVWIHPLRLDNDLYIDVMFFQVVPDYLEGLLVIMRSPETISASFMDDIARLGALLHCADDHWDGQYVNNRSVAQLLPRIVQNLRHVSLEQWSERVNAKLRQLSPKITVTQARAKFLEVLQSWTLFGSTFFYISHVTDPRAHGECLMSINKHGVQFLHMITHETLLDFRLNEILSTHKVMAANPATNQPVQFLDMKVGNLLQQRVISLQTDQCAEISRLLGQYIYVDSQNRGFINGNHNAVKNGGYVGMNNGQ